MVETLSTSGPGVLPQGTRAPGTVDVCLLGSVDVSQTGSPPVRLSSRALVLLAYLVTHPGTVQPRSHLAAALWPDSTDPQARTNLRRELHHLRTLLDGTGCLRVDPGGLAWCDEPGCRVDVRSFREACRQARRAADEGDRERLADQAGRALRCYQGPFFPGNHDEWVLEVRDELRHECVELCDRGVAFWREDGDLGEALTLAQRRVQLEPFEELGYRRLMQVQRAAGDRAGAVRTYHRCVSQLELELGVAPSAETSHELDELIGGPKSRPHGVEPPQTAQVAPSSTNALVGRGREQRQLLREWSHAQSGCRFVLVSGDAGVGKTRLMTDLAGAVSRQDGVVASARCFPATSELPLAPVAEWLRSPHLRLATRRLEPPWRAEADRLVPATGDQDDPSAGRRAKVDAWQRLRFFEGLARVVAAVNRPLLLTLDDVQWCDRASLGWLSFLLSFARRVPLLVVATARGQELAQSRIAAPLTGMAGAGQVTGLTLAELSRDATAVLATRALGRALTEHEVNLLFSATAGNPLYVIEAVREALSRDGLVHRMDLAGVLHNRLTSLAEPSQHVAALASAVGRDFTLDLLVEASDLGCDAVVRAVDDLWRRRILTEHGEGYDFTHDLVRQAVLDDVPPAKRWLLHRRLAEALERLYADRTELVATQLAEQYDMSRQPERALPFYLHAAEQATAVFAHPGAITMLNRCLTLLARAPRGRERDRQELDVLQRLSPPLNAWHGYSAPELGTTFKRSVELAEHLGLVPEQISNLVGLWAHTFVCGDTGGSYRLGTRALQLCESWPALAGQAHLAVGGSACSLAELDSADIHLAQACDLAGQTDSLTVGTRTTVHARAWWAHTKWLRGDEAGAVVAAQEAVRQARDIDHPYTLAVALSYAAVTRHMLCDRRGLDTVLGELTRLCEQFGFAYYSEWARILTGWLRGGADGLEMAREGLTNLQRGGSFARLPYWLSLLADVHLSLGDRAAARATLDAAAASGSQNDDRFWLPRVLRARTELETA